MITNEHKSHGSSFHSGLESSWEWETLQKSSQKWWWVTLLGVTWEMFPRELENKKTKGWEEAERERKTLPVSRHSRWQQTSGDENMRLCVWDNSLSVVRWGVNSALADWRIHVLPSAVTVASCASDGKRALHKEHPIPHNGTHYSQAHPIIRIAYRGLLKINR